MKRLLTFIYGLLIFSLGLLFEYKFHHTDEWYRWFYLLLCIILVIGGVDKLEKATK